MGVDTEVLGFKRYIVKTPKPYTRAEVQPADPEDKCQPERQFSTAGRLFAKEAMGVDGYNFPGGFPKQVALKALRHVNWRGHT